MSFKKLKLADKKAKTYNLEMSWGFIQQYIAQALYATTAIPHDQEIMSIKLDYEGGYVSTDKIIPIEVITKKGVKYLNIDDPKRQKL